MAQIAKNNVKIKFLLLDIIRSVGRGETAPEMAKRYGWTRQRLFYWFNKLEKGGFIKRAGRSSMVIYELTAQCKKINIGDVKTSSNGIRLHNTAYSYPIEKQGSIEIEKTWRLRGMTMNLKKLADCSLTWNEKTVNILIPSLIGDSAFELQDEAKTIADAAAGYLKANGFALGDGRLSRKPHYAIINPVIEAIAKQMEFSSADAKIDQSEGEGELEYFDPENVQSFIEMPKTMIKIVKVLKVFSDNIAIHNDAIKSMVLGLNMLNESIRTLNEMLNTKEKKDNDSRSLNESKH